MIIKTRCQDIIKAGDIRIAGLKADIEICQENAIESMQNRANEMNNTLWGRIRIKFGCEPYTSADVYISDHEAFLRIMRMQYRKDTINELSDFLYIAKANPNGYIHLTSDEYCIIFGAAFSEGK